MTHGTQPLAGYDIAIAGPQDAPELLVLQRCCWVEEAILNETLAIPALHEDVDEVVRWIRDWRVWVLRRGHRMVGAVRATSLDDEDWEIGRLMVAPDHRHLGLGQWLLAFAESHAPADAKRAVLFTGYRSERNVRIYEHAGYHVVSLPPTLAARVQGVVCLAKPLH